MKPRRKHYRKHFHYRRLKLQLRDTQNALAEAATAYTTALQALNDLLGYYDHPPSGWSRADGKKIERIRAIADGNSANYSK